MAEKFEEIAVVVDQSSLGNGIYDLTLKTDKIAKAAKAGKRKLSVSWKKNSKASGYQIRYSLKSSFSGAKTVMVRSGKTTTKKLTGLKRGKRYYITVRAYKTVKGKKYYSSWSKKIRYGVD